VNPTVEGYAAAVLEGAADASGVADELGAVEDVVRDNGTLFTAMTDTSVPGSARRAVLDDLLAGRVSDPVRRTAAFAAGQVAAPEVPATLAWLAVQARTVAEGEPVFEFHLSHLGARARVGGFASALFEELSNEVLDEVEDELFRFARTVAATPALRAALTDRDLPPEARKAVVRDLIGGKVQPATLRLVDFTIVGGRPRDFVGTLDYLVQQTAAARGWRVARVRAAQAVEGDERDHLERSLSGYTGLPVELQVTIDPGLLAGVIVEIGDLRLESTARSRLEHLRERLVSRGWEDQGFSRSGPTTED
jgi:F-type H+-transporting ATPase subunit delta